MLTELENKQAAAEDWSAEVDLILSALEAGAAPEDRRSGGRMSYRVKAELRLFSDAPAADPWLLFTRDVSPKGLGFITRHRLPLGYGGKIVLPTPTGQMVTIHCTLYRCREAASGWFEGALYFNRPQWVFTVQ